MPSLYYWARAIPHVVSALEERYQQTHIWNPSFFQKLFRKQQPLPLPLKRLKEKFEVTEETWSLGHIYLPVSDPPIQIGDMLTLYGEIKKDEYIKLGEVSCRDIKAIQFLTHTKPGTAYDPLAIHGLGEQGLNSCFCLSISPKLAHREGFATIGDMLGWVQQNFGGLPLNDQPARGVRIGW